ncbi:MAG: hypothetical protein QM708_14610 [Propioniciclava sp.]|uniref:lipopolysaccharide biosynthesis protein n=1 Tax=Propioniciclava sp. TaxID=2038686 RepID=UPI0039E3DF8A
MTAPEIVAPGKVGWRARLKRATLELDALALTMSTGVTALLGLAYWTIAARGFPMAEVGRASAIVSAATALATVSNLSLGGMYERFLPVSGRDTRRYLLRGGLATAALALLLGSGFLLLGPTERLFVHPWEWVGFPVLVITLAQFALLDNTLIGLRRARWAAVKNIAHAVAKLALAAGAAALMLIGGESLVLAWSAPALLLVILYLPAVWKHCGAPTLMKAAPSLPPVRELASYFGTSVGIMVVGASAPLVIPLIVVDRLGAELNAAFTMAWTLFSALALLLGTVLGPYIAQASAPGANARRLTLRFAAILSALAVFGALFLWFGAPVVLGLLGERYASETESLVRLMALSMPLSVVGILYAGVARVTRRLKLAMVMQVLTTVLVVGGVVLIIDRFGLNGIGYSYLVVEAVAAAILAVPTWRTIRRMT